MSNALDRVERAFASHSEATVASRVLAGDLVALAGIMRASLDSGGKLLFCGNGGSAADAQHLAAEFVGRFVKERRPLPALALHANTSTLTAVANDYGYDAVFEREVRAHGRRGDVLIAISTSGNSPSIVRAAQAARDMDLITIGMTGAEGGKLKSLCDRCLCVPSTITARIQEVHILLGHILCELVEAED